MTLRSSQGHRRLRFSSPLNNVKEQNPSPLRGQNRASNTPERPSQALQDPKLPGASPERTAPPMKMFYPNPFRRSTPFSKFFLEIGIVPMPSFSIQPSFSIRRSVFASASTCSRAISSIRKPSLFRQRSHEGLPYTGAHGSCRGSGPCRTPDQDPDEQGDPEISVMPASFEIEARPN
jgi:hypothetical protein